VLNDVWARSAENARWRYNPSRPQRARAALPPPAPKPPPGRQQSPDGWPRSPIPAQTAGSRLAGRVDLC
jgi:hypothetical protein